MCACGAKVETTKHFFLHCHLYSTQGFELLQKIGKADPHFLNLTAKDQVLVSLYSLPRNSSKISNQNIIKIAINYLKSTDKFDRSIFTVNQKNFCLSYC